MPDLLSRLLRGDITSFCQYPDGRRLHSAPLPKAILSGSFNPLHTGHKALADVASKRLGLEIHFELTLRNADKPALNIDEAEQRMRQFLNYQPLWLTMARTFVGRAKLFPGTVWVVGADTAVRILEPRFYQNNEGLRDGALGELRAGGGRFLVAGRMDVSGRFLGLEEIVVPPGFRDLFEEIPEREFRMDITSTGLRNS